MGKNRLVLHWVTILAIALFTFLAISSASIPPVIVFDESVPAEEAVNIYIQPGIEVTSYNGISVPTKNKPSAYIGFESEWHDIVLPPGEVEFILSIGVSTSSTIYRRRDVPFRYTFKPLGGLYYILEFTSYGGDNRNEQGINIYKAKDSRYVKGEFVAFVPFPRVERAILQ